LQHALADLFQNLTATDVFLILAMGLFVDLMWGLLFRASVVAYSRTRPPKSGGTGETPYISIIVPCHNSDDVIDDTLRSLIDSGYPKREIIVVDDASTDKTYEKVTSYGRAVTLLHKSKSGGRKTEAVNFGLLHARGEIVVVIDDDTKVAPGALQELIRPLENNEVAAVGGNIKVKTEREGLLVKLQAVEYMVSMELGRAFQSTFYRGVVVISGCFGAFRRDVLRRIGQYDPDTITEDLDLTWKIYRLLKRVDYSPKAICYTEAPRTLKALIRQRTRWDRGLLETLAKHRGMMTDSKIGRAGFLLMDTLIFEIALLFARPLWVLTLVTLLYAPWTAIILTVGFYFTLEFLTILVAGLLSNDKRNVLKTVYAPAIFVYRQLLGLIRMRATILRILGRRAMW